MERLAVHEKKGVVRVTETDFDDLPNWEEIIEADNNKGWFYSLTRDLTAKISECDALKQELDKIKKERVSLFEKIENLKIEIECIKDKKSVPVEWVETNSGIRSHCGFCGHSISNADTFCKRCGCIIKWVKRPWKGVI